VFTFSILAMAQNITGRTAGVAQIFVYAGATVVLIGWCCSCAVSAAELGQREVMSTTLRRRACCRSR
jgi:NADH:ubiquinone oxidoreductase subunit 6 (subunit J)